MRNKTFRIFVSSTFSDFEEEREILNGPVSKTVGDFCRSKGYDLQLVDLRWGISEEAALNQKTIPICLDEVRRCQANSPKPNFLLMVGERYGWIPLPYTICVPEFTAILSACSPGDSALLTAWYHLDDNSLDGEYYLIPRRGEYAHKEVWNPVQAQLQRILISAAARLGLDPDPYCTSATEQEIMQGFLANPDICDNTVAIFRNGHPSKDADLHRITRLRQRVVDRMGRDGVDGSLIELDLGDSYAQHFRETVEAALLEHIRNEIGRLDRLQASFQPGCPLPEPERGNFYGRERELAALNEYVNSKQSHPCFVVGESGSGKSSLLAEFIHRLTLPCVYVFFGADDTSYTIFDSVDFICRQIRSMYSLPSAYLMTPQNMMEAFWDTLNAVPSDQTLVIVIDALDMFYDMPGPFDLAQFPELPDHVKLVVSTTPDAGLPTDAPGSTLLQISGFSQEESEAAFALMMKSHDRRIRSPWQEKIVSDALAGGCLPLQLRLLTDICSGWHSEDWPNAISDSPTGTALQYITSMYEHFGHDRELVLYSLALILAAPYGLGEDELQVLLPKAPSVCSRLTKQTYHAFDTKKLPFAVWSRLFYDLEKCLRLTERKGFTVVQISHQVFARAFSGAFPEYCREARALLTDHYLEEPTYCVSAQRVPNRKKCVSILPLLESSNMHAQAAALLQDVSFIDASCKSDSLDGLLFAYRSQISCTKDPVLQKRLIAFDTCLQQNREMLRCYRGSALACLKSAGLIEEDISPISFSSHASAIGFEGRPFPYSQASRLAWSPCNAYLAVAHGKYVYICDGETRSQNYSIYVASPGNRDDLICNIVWAADDLLAVQLTNQSLYIYQVGPTSATFLWEVKNTLTDPGILTAGNGVIVYYSKDHDQERLCGYQATTGEELYRIDGSSEYDMGIIEDMLVVIPDSKPSAIQLYHVATGQAIGRKGLHGSLSSFHETTIISWGATHWLSVPVRNVTLDRVALLRCGNGRKDDMFFEAYYSFPQPQKIRAYLPGTRSLIIVYSSGLIWMEPGSAPSMHALAVGPIDSVAWKDVDQTLNVLENGCLLELSRDDFFSAADIGACFVSRKDPVPKRSLIGKAASMIKQLCHLATMCYFGQQYCYQIMYLPDDGSLRAPERNASLLSFATDGKYAVAYEGMDEVRLYSEDHAPILVISGLRLSAKNSILKMGFSPDAQYCYLWRSCSIEIFCIRTRHRIMKLNLSWRPALFVSFSSDSTHIRITLCNHMQYSFSLTGWRSVPEGAFPRRLLRVRQDKYMFPYMVPARPERDDIIALVSDSDDLDFSPSRFTTNRVYRGEKHSLLFKEGDFYLDGDETQHFESLYADFALSLHAERIRDRSPFNAFLREKNDISSELLEIGDGKLLILISRLLNSVIVFDRSAMTVVAAYKHRQDIIGWRVLQQEQDIQLELFSAHEPHATTLELSQVRPSR